MFGNWPYNGGMPRTSPPKPPKELGARLIRLRKAAGLTQAEMAEALGIPQTTISYYEREAAYLPSTILAPLAQLLGVPIGEIIGVEGQEPGKRGPKSQLERQFEAVRKLPQAKQKVISAILVEFIGNQA